MREKLLKQQFGEPFDIELSNIMLLSERFHIDIDKLLKMNTTRIDILLGTISHTEKVKERAMWFRKHTPRKMR